MEKYLLDEINSVHHEDFELLWKFYTIEDEPCSKNFGEYHLRKILKSDCQAVFRVNDKNEIDWVGYSSDDYDDKRKNALIKNPWNILKQSDHDQSIVYIVLRNKEFRYLTITKMTSNENMYEIMDYEKLQ